MDKLKLINPLEGQKNWGHAINSNFQKLYDGYTAALSQLQGLKNRVEELDTLQINSEEFICIIPNGTKVNARIIGIKYWINPHNAPKTDASNMPGKAFVASEYLDYQAWFVQVDPNYQLADSIGYEGYSWDTGDMLIVHKEIVGNQTVPIKQWKNIMGGYFQPTEQEMTPDGTLVTTYNKTPSFSVMDTVDLTSPTIYWKPEGYNSRTLQMRFVPYQKKGANETQLTMSPIDIDMAGIIQGFSRYETYAGGQKQTFTISGVPNTVGFDIHCMSEANDILYFPYEYEIKNNTLIIVLDTTTYNDNYRARINLFGGV